MKFKSKRITSLILAIIMVMTFVTPNISFAATATDSDLDGIPDSLEGYCPTAELFQATPSFPTDSFTASGADYVTINPTGGKATTDLAITVDGTSREQVKFAGAYEFYDNAELTGDNVDNNTSLILHIGGANGTTFFTAGSTTEEPDSFTVFIPQEISKVIGNGTPASPWKVQVTYYADVDGNGSFSATKDIQIKQLYTYVNGTTHYRRDYQIIVGSGAGKSATKTLKIYEWRDAQFNGQDDAGYGMYVDTAGAIKRGENKVVPDAKMVGILEDKGGGDLNGVFMAFVQVSPWKSYFVNAYDLG
ncbi:MAG: hypothetical protein Q4G11_06790, partial [Gallicola sp.]|nr:hypothetical protein [Gallicola sp.]